MLISWLLPLSMVVLLMVLVAMVSANEVYPLEKSIKPLFIFLGFFFINLLVLTLEKIVGFE